MTGRISLKILSCTLLLSAAGCASFYEIPIETPIAAKLDVSAFQRVFIAGFLSGGTEDVDGNVETVRLLRSQLRLKSNLRVVDADAKNTGALYNLALVYEKVDPKEAVNLWERYIGLAGSQPSEKDWVDVARLHLKKLKQQGN